MPKFLNIIGAGKTPGETHDRHFASVRLRFNAAIYATADLPSGLLLRGLPLSGTPLGGQADVI
jgi:hypothetical protein